MERHQVALYLAALAFGAAAGLLIPAAAAPAELAINPVLGLLLYATFLGVPFAKLRDSVRGGRFLATVLVVNFVLVPVVVWALTRAIAHQEALLIGALFVLLAPCVDYVIVFTGLAGGAKDRLIAAAPLLMLAQMLLLPVYLWIMEGPAFVDAVELAPFLEALLFLIVLPLVAAGLTQLVAARTRWGRVLHVSVSSAMVPLMMLTLAVVVVSQIAAVGHEIRQLALVVPVYVAFAAVMVPLGAYASRMARLDVPSSRAVVLSGVTRNSLVVLPLVLALPDAFALAPLAVVTQTLVELVVMVIFVRLLPKLLPMTTPSRAHDSTKVE